MVRDFDVLVEAARPLNLKRSVKTRRHRKRVECRKEYRDSRRR